MKEISGELYKEIFEFLFPHIVLLQNDNIIHPSYFCKRKNNRVSSFKKNNT